MNSQLNSRFAEECRQLPLELLGAENAIYVESTKSRPLDCEKDIYIGLFFDGTNNNKYRDAPTNDLVFGPDNAPYANTVFTGGICRSVVFGAADPARELFGNVLQPDNAPRFTGPDGMKFGTDCRCCCAAYGVRAEERDRARSPGPCGRAPGAGRYQPAGRRPGRRTVPASPCLGAAPSLRGGGADPLPPIRG